MRPVRQLIGTYGLAIREKAARIVDDLHRARPLSARKREEAILKLCEVLAREEHA
jgi:hypothetical protein